MKKKIVLLPVIMCLSASAVFGTNLANPAAPVSDARLSVGASYFVNGLTVTNDSIPMITNRFGLRVGYAPIRYFSFGLDVGTMQIDVERYVVRRDTVPVFNSGVGWSVGGHLKVASPYVFDYVSAFGLVNANFFRAENDFGAWYGGKEAVGVIGVQGRIPGFGYVSAGPQVHLVIGENKPYNSKRVGQYSNLNNVRLWLAVDYLPDLPEHMSEMMGENKPFATFEFTMSPKINGSRRVPIQEFSIAISVGVITKRLYGEDMEALD